MPYTKIGMHFMSGNDKGEGYSKLAAPTVIKLVNAFGDADKIVNLPHKPLVIGRISRDDAKPEDQILRSTPQQCVNWYFDNFLSREIVNNPAIHWWETINEPVVNIENVPISEWIRRMRWVDEYQHLSALHLAGLGKNLVAFNFSVGNPAWELWQYAPKTLSLTKSHGVILGLHRYLELIRLPDGGIDYQKTVNGFWGLYHEKENEVFAQLGFVPNVVITECGLENIGAGKPWKTEGITAREYATIMHLWGKRLELSPQVVGATVFTTGGAGWESYDVANTEFEKHMIAFSQNNVPIVPNPPPPAVPDETPLFKFHGRGQWFRFYRSPNLSSDTPPRTVNWEIEVFELRPYGGPAGVWARVTRKTSKTQLWMRLGV